MGAAIPAYPRYARLEQRVLEDQSLHDRMWEDVPEPERDPHIEKLVDEIFLITE